MAYIISCVRRYIGKTLQSYFNNGLKYGSSNKQIRCYACKPKIKVTLLGGMGATGKPLALLLKQSPLIDELCLYDIKAVDSFVAELNHIDTYCEVTGFCGLSRLPDALQGSAVTVMLAAAPNSHNKNYDDMFCANAPIVQKLTEEFGWSCPKSILAVVTNPINSIVPMISEVLKKQGAYSPNTIIGVVTANVVRCNTFSAAATDLEPECVQVPIIGGHTEDTLVPIFSQMKPCAEMTPDQLEQVTKDVRMAQSEVIKLKPNESDCLTGAFSAARFVISTVKGIRGYPEVVECGYVRSTAHPNLKYMITPLLLGTAGVMRNLGVPPITDFENCLLDNAIPILIRDIQKGEHHMGVIDPPVCDPCDVNPDPRCDKRCDMKQMLGVD